MLGLVRRLSRVQSRSFSKRVYAPRLLEYYGGASAAYSLRSLNGEDPKAVRIRRDGDNEERDFTTSEIGTEAADWTNGLQETTLPADLPSTSSSITGFTISGTSDASSGTYTTSGSLLNGKLFFRKTGANDEQVRYDGSKWLIWDDDNGEAYWTPTNNQDTEFPWDVTSWQVGEGGGGPVAFSSFVGGNPDNSAAGAYSLRKVKSDYTGNAVRIRRASDNVEVNVSFDTNDEVSTSSPITNVAEPTSISFSSTWDIVTGTPASSTLSPLTSFRITDAPSGFIVRLPITTSIRAGNSVDVSTYISTLSGNWSYYLGDYGGGVVSNIETITSGTTLPTLTATGTPYAIYLRSNSTTSSFGVSYGWGGTVTIGDTTSTNLGDFISGTNAHVTTWYDQSGNSKNATQTVATNQPLIADGGNLHTNDGKPALKFNGTSNRLELSAKATIANTSIFSAFRSNSNTQDSVLFHLAVNASNVVSIGFGDLATRSELGSRLRVGGSDVVHVGDNAFTSTSQSLLGYIASSTAAKMFVDSTEKTVEVESRTSGANNRIGARGNDEKFFNGDISEVILYDSDQTNNRFKIESNINNYYTIYTAAQNGFVNTWYDQSGNGFNAVADADENEPKIVNSGSLLTDGVKFSESKGLELSGTGLDIFKNTQHAQIFYAIKINDTSTSTTGFFEARTNTSGSRVILRNSNDTAGRISLAGRRLDSDSFSSFQSDSGHNNEKVVLTGFINYSDTDAFIFKNGTQIGSDTSFLTAGATSDTSSSTITIGRKTALEATAEFDAEELIIFNTDQTANRTAIETNMINHYGIS